MWSHYTLNQLICCSSDRVHMNVSHGSSLCPCRCSSRITSTTPSTAATSTAWAPARPTSRTARATPTKRRLTSRRRDITSWTPPPSRQDLPFPHPPFCACVRPHMSFQCLISAKQSQATLPISPLLENNDKMGFSFSFFFFKMFCRRKRTIIFCTLKSSTLVLHGKLSMSPHCLFTL